jgi:hypothetical protein
MLIRLAALLCASHLVAPVVDRVPELNLTQLCTVSTRADDAQDAKKEQQNCLAFEQKAKLQLAMQWSRYSAADQSSCLQISRSAGQASYVEILTCLEMAEHVRGMRKSRGPGSLLTGEGEHREFREGCPSELASTQPELVPDGCF